MTYSLTMAKNIRNNTALAESIMPHVNIKTNKHWKRYRAGTGKLAVGSKKKTTQLLNLDFEYN